MKKKDKEETMIWTAIVTFSKVELSSSNYDVLYI